MNMQPPLIRSFFSILICKVTEAVKILPQLIQLPNIIFENTALLHNLYFRGFFLKYKSDTVNSNMVNLKFYLIRSFFEIFARFLSFHV